MYAHFCNCILRTKNVIYLIKTLTSSVRLSVKCAAQKHPQVAKHEHHNSSIRLDCEGVCGCSPAPQPLYSVCLCSVIRMILSGGSCLTLDSSTGHAAPRYLLTRSLFALVGHRNLPQPLVPTASLPGTTRCIFILYKLNLYPYWHIPRLRGAWLHSRTPVGASLCPEKWRRWSEPSEFTRQTSIRDGRL